MKDDQAQRITVMLEYNREHEEWQIVAYLIWDTGRRQRSTLRSFRSRAEVSTALQALWSDLPNLSKDG